MSSRTPAKIQPTSHCPPPKKHARLRPVPVRWVDLDDTERADIDKWCHNNPRIAAKWRPILIADPVTRERVIGR